MEIALFGLLVAAGGGFFGAAIGGLHAFVFTGLMALVGSAIAVAGGGTGFLDDVALGRSSARTSPSPPGSRRSPSPRGAPRP